MERLYIKRNSGNRPEKKMAMEDFEGLVEIYGIQPCGCGCSLGITLLPGITEAEIKTRCHETQWHLVKQK